MAVFGVVALYRGRLRPWLYRGDRGDEIAAVLPGDELVSTNTPRTTRAVTVDAPIAAVWPWLAQIGEHRGGFYSYSCWNGLSARISTTQTPSTLSGRTCRLATQYGSPAGTATEDGRLWLRSRQDRIWC